MFTLLNRKIQQLAQTKQGVLKNPALSTLHQCASNPLCGDKVCWHRLRNRALAYEVKGCMLCEASCELLWASLQQGESFADMYAKINDLLHSKQQHHPFSVFQPVVEYPMRHSCILLPFEVIGGVIE